MKNLTERLDQHLQNIRESNGEISFRTFVNYLKANAKPLILKLGDCYASNLIMDAIEHASRGDIAAKESNKSQLFADSYVGADVYYFMVYCICSCLDIDSGIDINKAYKDIEKLVKTGEEEYEYRVKNDNLEKDNDFTEEEKQEIMRNDIPQGIKMKEVIAVADDWGDEFMNPLDFVSESSKVAKKCKANQLASKLQPLVKKASWILDRTYLM